MFITDTTKITLSRHIYTVIFLMLSWVLPASGQEPIIKWNTEHVPIQLFSDSISKMLAIQEDPTLQNVITQSDSLTQNYAAIVKRSVLSGRQDSIAWALVKLAWSHHIAGKLDTSMSMLKIGWFYNQLSPTPSVTAMIYHLLANHYTAQNNNAQAVYCSYKALETVENSPIDDYQLIARIYSITAKFLITSGQDSKAHLYLNAAIKLVSSHNDSAFLALFYNNMGHIYYSIGKNDQAIEYLKAAFDIANRINTHRTQILAATNLATIYSSIGNLDEAKKYGQEALNVSTAHDSPREAIHAAYTLAGIYVRAGNYQSAIDLLQSAINRASAMGLQENISQAYLTLAYAYRMSGAYAKAFHYIDKYLASSDRDAQERFTRLAYQMENRFVTAKKDKEIAEQQLKIVEQRAQLRQKNIWIGTSILISTLIALLLYSLYRNGQQKQKAIAQELTVLRQSQELAQLHATIDGEEKERTRLARELHDGIMVQFATVKMELSMLPNTHPTLVHSHAFQRILQHLDTATQELRHVSHHLMPDILMKNGLTEAVLYFCSNLQTSSGIMINAQLPDALPEMADDFQLFIYRTVQELLQNVVKHAEATEAIVQLTAVEHMLTLTVEDNGKGFDTNEWEQKKGIGLSGIRSRVEALQGYMDLTTDNQGTTIYVELMIRDKAMSKKE